MEGETFVARSKVGKLESEKRYLARILSVRGVTGVGGRCEASQWWG